MPLRKHKVTLRLILATLLSSPFVTGCWDRLEIEQRASVLGLSLDVQDSETKSDSLAADVSSADATGSSEIKESTGGKVFQLTAQIAVPGRIPLGPGSGSGGGDSESKSSVWVLGASGRTVNDALTQLQQRVADRLFLGHLRVIVVSAAFAKEQGLTTLTDFLIRNPEVRRTVWVTVSKGRASELMQTSPPLERVPTLYLLATLDHSAQVGKLPKQFFGKFASILVMKGRDPVLPYLEVWENDNVNVDGLAFFKGDKMVGASPKPVDILPYMQLDGVRRAGYTILVQVPGHSGTVMWRGMRRKKKIKVTIQDGVPTFTVRVHVDGNIVEKSDESFTLNNPVLLEALDQRIARMSKENMERFISMSKEMRVDPIGFGEYVRARQRKYWDTKIRTKEKWEQMYLKSRIQVVVDVRTDRVGMKST